MNCSRKFPTFFFFFGNSLTSENIHPFCLPRYTTLCATTWCSTWSAQCSVWASPPPWPSSKGNWPLTWLRWSSSGSYKGSKTNWCVHAQLGGKKTGAAWLPELYIYPSCSGPASPIPTQKVGPAVKGRAVLWKEDSLQKAAPPDRMLKDSGWHRELPLLWANLHSHYLLLPLPKLAITSNCATGCPWAVLFKKNDCGIVWSNGISTRQNLPGGWQHLFSLLIFAVSNTAIVIIRNCQNLIGCREMFRGQFLSHHFQRHLFPSLLSHPARKHNCYDCCLFFRCLVAVRRCPAPKRCSANPLTNNIQIPSSISSSGLHAR